MPHPDARHLTLLLVTAGVCLTATGAEAQSGRYMTWANRPASTAPATLGAALTHPVAVSAAAEAEATEIAADAPPSPVRSRNDLIPRRVAPSQGPVRPMMQTATTNVSTSRGLTPASAWLGPRVAPAFAPGTPDPIAYAMSQPVSVPAPAPVREMEPVYAPPPATYSAALAPTPPPPPPSAPPVEAAPAPAAAAADPWAPRRDAAIFNLHRPTQPAPVQSAAAQPVDTQSAEAEPTEAPADPMAPRRDAPIFQLQSRQGQQPVQQQAALPPAPLEAQVHTQAPAPAQAGQSRSRYYSVHRDAGRQPDRAVLPEPVFFDSVSMDLAEQPANEPLVRDGQGRRRVVANLDPSQP